MINTVIISLIQNNYPGQLKTQKGGRFTPDHTLRSHAEQ